MILGRDTNSILFHQGRNLEKAPKFFFYAKHLHLRT